MMPQNLDILPAQEQRHFVMGISSTGSASGKSSEIRVTDSGGAVNFAHKVRFPGSEDVNGFSDVHRHAPSEVRSTLYFRLLRKSTSWKFSTLPLPGSSLFLISPPVSLAKAIRRVRRPPSVRFRLNMSACTPASAPSIVLTAVPLSWAYPDSGSVTESPRPTSSRSFPTTAILQNVFAQEGTLGRTSGQ